jgi:hypothetical protein
MLVPCLAKKVKLKTWLNGKTLAEAANGESLLHKTLREGIVIRPILENYDADIGGRLILKQISPEYLAKAD